MWLLFFMWSSRRYLALCVGETRVRIDLQEPLRPQVTQNHDGNPSKTPLSPSTLRFLSQVGVRTQRWGVSVWSGSITFFLFLLCSCCHSTLTPWMWWCWTCCFRSLSGTWQAQLSLFFSTTSAKGTKYVLHHIGLSKNFSVCSLCNAVLCKPTIHHHPKE